MDAMKVIYGISILFLASFFIWLLLRMATFSIGGEQRLISMSVGLFALIVIPGVILWLMSRNDDEASEE